VPDGGEVSGNVDRHNVINSDETDETQKQVLQKCKYSVKNDIFKKGRSEGPPTRKNGEFTIIA